MGVTRVNPRPSGQFRSGFIFSQTMRVSPQRVADTSYLSKPDPLCPLGLRVNPRVT